MCKLFNKFKKWMVGLCIGVIVAIGSVALIPNKEVVHGVVRGKELTHERQHNVKVYELSSGQRQADVGMVNYHYHNGESFKDIPALPFPEGKLINSEADLDMITVPAWGNARVEESGKVVRVYDKKGVSIYRFHTPEVLPAHLLPLKVIDAATGIEKRRLDYASYETERRAINIDTERIIFDKENATSVDFEVVKDKIRFKLPQGMNPSGLRAYDETDETSTNNKDTCIYEENANASDCEAALVGIGVRGRTDLPRRFRSFIEFTLPGSLGTITAIDLSLNVDTQGVHSNDLHEVTQTAWTATGATWNKYDGTNTWTTAGGDYSSTIVDTVTPTTAGSRDTYGLVGAGAINPISLTWGGTTNLVIEDPDNVNALTVYSSAGDATESERPKITITYTPSATTQYQDIIWFN